MLYAILMGILLSGPAACETAGKEIRCKYYDRD